MRMCNRLGTSHNPGDSVHYLFAFVVSSLLVVGIVVLLALALNIPRGIQVVAEQRFLAGFHSGLWLLAEDPS